VEAGDAARRVLERNLHDGAQQRLLALLFDLRLAHSSAGSHGEHALTADLEAALYEADAALEELRDVAHGIHPAILTEAGLGAARGGRVDRARTRGALTDRGPERYPKAVEPAAFVAATEAIGDATRRAATYAVLRLRHSRARLVLEVEDDGACAESTPLA